MLQFEMVLSNLKELSVDVLPLRASKSHEQVHVMHRGSLQLNSVIPLNVFLKHSKLTQVMLLFEKGIITNTSKLS